MLEFPVSKSRLMVIAFSGHTSAHRPQYVQRLPRYCSTRPAYSGDRQQLINSVRDALYCSKICAYAQGFQLMREAQKEYGWKLDFATIASIWRGGCIIRARFLQKITDAFTANAGLVMGGRPVRPYDVDLRWVGALLHKNGVIEETGLAAGVLNHPANGVAWLANRLAPYGESLEPGQIVLAGSFTRPVFAARGDTLHADYGPLGSVAFRFV